MDQTMLRRGLVPLLDEETWAAPERLSVREGRDEAGEDWAGEDRAGEHRAGENRALGRDGTGFDDFDREEDR